MSWNGTAFQVRAGGEIHWTITVVHDDAANPSVEVSIDDYVPNTSYFPVVPFTLATDVLATPPTGSVTLDVDGWLHDRNVAVALGETVALTFRTKVSATAPVGTAICNWALVDYAPIPPPGGLGMPTYAYTIDSLGNDTETCVVVTSDPSLGESTKVASDASGNGVIEPGEVVSYTIVARNTGASDATGVVVTDELDPLLALVSAGQGGVLAGRTLTWRPSTTPALNRLRPGESATLTFSATAGCVPENGQLCNQAMLTSVQVPAAVPTDDPATPAVSSPTCLPTANARFEGSPLTASESSGDGRFSPGEAVSLDLAATNTGTVAASDLTVRIPIPSGLVSVVPRNGGTVSAGEIRWTPAGEPALASLAPGAAVALGFDATVDPAAALGTSTCLQASMAAAAGCPTGLSDDPATPAAADPTCITVSSPPLLDFALTAVDGAGRPATGPGGTIEYEAVLTWLGGDDASDVSVSVAVPGPTVLGSLQADEGGTAGASTLTWSSAATPALARLGPGDVVRLHGRGTVLCTAPDAIPACATGTLVATNLPSPLESDDPRVPGTADPSCLDVAAPVLASTLVATDADGDGQFEPGETVTLDLRVRNEGSAPASQVSVSLPLWARTLNVAPLAGGRLGAGVLDWDAATTTALASLDPGTEAVLGLTFRIDPAAAGERACHQGTVLWAEGTDCGPLLTDDPSLAAADDPTCWDVTGEGLPPGEVPDGDPLDGGPVPVRLTCQGADLVLTWDRAPRAVTHQVYRGPMASFRIAPWTNPAVFIDDPENSGVSCGLVTLTYVYEGECAPGGASHYFLVAGRNLVGDGPLGEMFQGGVLTERPPVQAPCP